jgi:hypothetical protein
MQENYGLSPNKRKEERGKHMSNIVKFGGGFIAFVFFAGVYGSAKNESDRNLKSYEDHKAKLSGSAATSVKQEPAPPPPPPPPPRECSPFTAKELKSAMASNEAKTAHVWKNAGCASVSGSVLTIGSDFMDDPFVVIGTGKKYEFGGIVHCTPKNKTAAFDLSKGQKVTVRGTTGGEMMGTLMLEDCEW